MHAPVTGIVAAMLVLTILTSIAPTVTSEEASAPLPPVDREAARDAVLKGLTWLATKQWPDGGWGPTKGAPGVTALVLAVYTQAGFDHTNQTVQRGLQFLRGYYIEESGLLAETYPNYENSAALVAMLGANDPQDTPRIRRMMDAQLALQYSPTAPLNDSVSWYVGGWPNNAGIPDTSNGQFAMIGLMAAELLDPSLSVPQGVWDGTIKIAKQSQNWPAVNNFTWAHNASLPSYADGGFVYNSLRSRTPLGEQMFESYGSITAAGLIMYLASGHGYDHPETAAARAWLEREYTLEENPRVEGKGLYYYLWSLSRVLAMSSQDWLVDGAGKLHDARSEIAQKFIGLQRADGRWDGNPFSGWREEEPELAAMYALWALEASYLVVPNPRFELEVSGASAATFVGVDGTLLATDPAKGLTVTSTKLTCTDPETFRKLWVLLEGTEGATAMVSATGTWGQGRTSRTTIQVRLGAHGGSVFSATGGFAGPFGIHLQPYAGGPRLSASEAGRLDLVRGEVSIIELVLEETTGVANATGVDVVVRLPPGATADAGAQHVTVPRGGSATVELTVFVNGSANKGRAGELVVISNDAPPLLIEVHYVDDEDGGGTPPAVYWALVLVLFAIVAALVALPMLGKRGASREDSSKAYEQADEREPGRET